ncbi:MAG: MFS transporter [Lachnospiraceae bacterium]|nr:MFS transporter [Lachnospiraceae bacterium]
MKEKLTKSEISWILYDVGNSAFTMLVATTIPIFFQSLAANSGITEAETSGIWASVTAVSVLILAILSPLLGAIADYKGMKKPIFSCSLCISILALLVLSFTNHWLIFLVVFVIARLSYSACNVFYDSMITDVTTDERMDMISSHGFAWGYIGSCIPFVAGILLIFTRPFGLSTGQATQLSFLIAAVWWVCMTIPLLKNVKQTYYLERCEHTVSHVFKRLGATFKKLKNDKRILFFVIAYFCYIDGVYTIISLSTTYGGEVGIDSTAMILALLVTQIVAFPCAILSGRLAEKFGSLKLIKFFILCYIVICLFAYQLDQAWEFWLLAIAVGMCQGGIQSLSRAYYGKLIPKEEASEYFGFFDIFGKFADFFGPVIIAACAFVFGTSTYGLLALALLFLTGFILLSKSEKA